MNIYLRNFKFFEEYVKDLNSQVDSCQKLFEMVYFDYPCRGITIKDPDFKNMSAVIIIGYSGSGKTTFINEFCKKNRFFESISMDDTYKEVLKSKSRASDMEVITVFGKKLECSANSRSNIIIDGLWLNVFTRMALLKTLKELGYTTYIVDIADDNIMYERLKLRADDLTVAALVKRYFPNESKNVNFLKSNKFASIGKDNLKAMLRMCNEWKINYADVINFYEKEKSRNEISIQRKVGLIAVQADYLII